MRSKSLIALFTATAFLPVAFAAMPANGGESATPGVTNAAP